MCAGLCECVGSGVKSHDAGGSVGVCGDKHNRKEIE